MSAEGVGDELAATQLSDAGSGDTPPARPSMLGRGQPIGRFVVLDVLGEGGMGVVYAAHDPQLDRKVAIKLLRPAAMGSDVAAARLLREAQAMARIDHPNVLRVYEAGPHEDRVYVAMEIATAGTLRGWLAAGKHAPAAILAKFVEAGRGLAAAHAAGLVHRDFKPDNVLLFTDGRVRVTDFGLVGVIGDAAGGRAASVPGPISDTTPLSQPLTRTGLVMGTPAYMAPEQFNGEPVGPAGDQFAFCVALYEALFGERPFAGDNFAELCANVTSGEHRVPRRAGVSPRVQRAVLRGLATKPANRFASMDALLRELVPPRRRWHWFGGAAAVVAAVAVGVIALDRPAPAVEAPVGGPASRTRLLIPPFSNATGDTTLDSGLDDVVASIAERSTALDSVAGADLLQLAARNQVDPQDGDALAARVTAARVLVVRGSVTPAAAGYAVTLAVTDRRGGLRCFAADTATRANLADVTGTLAERVLEQLGEPPAAVHVPSPSIAAVHAWSLGRLALLGGDGAAAIARFRNAIAIDPDYAEAHASLGIALAELQQFAPAQAELDRALASNRLPERVRLSTMGDFYDDVGRYSESILAYQQLLARWPADLRAEINLVAVAIDADSWPLALAAARNATTDHPGLEVSQRNLVLAELGNEQLGEAVRDGDELLSRIPEPAGFGMTAVMIAHELTGERDKAAAVVTTIASRAPDFYPNARADLALYEGRLDDAATALGSAAGPNEQLFRTRLLLRRGDLAGARITAAGMSFHQFPDQYFAQALAIDAGVPDALTVAADAARTWRGSVEGTSQLFGALLEGDVARAQHRVADALAAYQAAARIDASWLTHDRLARGFADAGQDEDAERELRWCLAHRGQASLTDNPSLALLPEVYLQLARLLDRRRAPRDEVRAAYRALAELGPTAQRDPWTDEARRALER
jgi:tetratricopeptide (TPR) repeat protein